MIDKERIRTFRQRWRIDVSREEDFRSLRARIVALIDKHLGPLAEFNDLKTEYAFLSGGPNSSLRQLSAVIEAAKNVVEIVHRIQPLLWALFRSGYAGRAASLSNDLRVAFALSPSLDIVLLGREDGFMMYPSGAELLDQQLVEETLDWLAAYPEVEKPFHEALRMYAAKETLKYRNLLDNLRFSLEQMLRAVLGNQKSLENQKLEALKWLANHQIHAHITNMYNDLITRFASYQNDAVKHSERYSATEIEFMIYLTGAFLRFLVQLHRENSKSQNK